MKGLFRSDNPEKDWTEDFQHENGNYSNTCCICKAIFVGHKRRVICKVCVKETNTKDNLNR